MIPVAFSMILRLINSYIRMRCRAKQAKWAFYRELKITGMPTRDANSLAGEYVATAKLRLILKILLQHLS